MASWYESVWEGDGIDTASTSATEVGTCVDTKSRYQYQKYFRWEHSKEVTQEVFLILGRNLVVFLMVCKSKQCC